MNNSFENIVAIVIILNILAYLIKYILKTKGYPVSWFSKHLRDIPNLWKLFGKTKKTGERIFYFILGTGVPILTIVFAILAFSEMKNFAEGDPCLYEGRFRQTEWGGVVTKKYIDKQNHAYETIEINNQGQTQKIQNWALSQNGNFEQIEIGDSIVKKKGLVNVSLYKPDEEIILIVDYGCEESKNNNR
jgi:hypothetical protein